MAFTFCRLNENNIVVNAEMVDPENGATQEGGEAFLRDLHKEPNTRFIKIVAGEPKLSRAAVDWIYREDLNGFHSPQPYPSWTLNETTCEWVPPTPIPDDATGPGVVGPKYSWDEDNQTWIKHDTNYG